MQSTYGFSHFLAHLDPVGQAALYAMVLLSVASWSVAIVKAWQIAVLLWIERRRVGRPGKRMTEFDSPWVRIDAAGTDAAWRLSRASSDPLLPLSHPEVVVTGALGRALAVERSRLERGLALVATASSTAPFVGLFGTVWSIHHALVAIGTTGEGGLDKVAGPVGEALVMTGIGLAVAIPALVCYNALVAAQAGLLHRMEGFARDLFERLALAEKGDHGIVVTEIVKVGKR